MYYLLFYETVADYAEKRDLYRAPHRAHGKTAYERGELVMAGALADPVDGVVLVFKGDDEQVAEQFARDDPYVQNGLITKWHVRPWSVVLGGV